MAQLDDVVRLNPIVPQTGPLSQRGGPSSLIQSIVGVPDWQTGLTIIAEQVQSLQGQSDAIYSILRLSPTVQNLNFPFPIVLDLALSSNNPSAGNISWSPCTILYNGQLYGIASGNTSSGEKLVWWVVGNNTFSIGNSFTPNATTFPIATNTSGTADLSWNKLGSNSIQAANVIGGLLPPGYQIQTPATVTVNSGGVTSLLSYTGAGALLTMFAQIGLKTTGGSTIQITVDGQPSQTITLMDSGGGGLDGFDTQANAMAVDGGIIIANTTGIVLGFYTSFQVSISVQVTVTGYTSGASVTGVGWAKKI